MKYLDINAIAFFALLISPSTINYRILITQEIALMMSKDFYKITHKVLKY